MVIVSLVYWLVLGSEFFLIKRITVHGSLKNVTSYAIKANYPFSASETFFNVPMIEIQKRMVQLPWVRAVTVRRKFPNTLDFDLEEHVVVARWEGDSEKNLINTFAEPFFAEFEHPQLQVLPVLSAKDEQASRVLSMYVFFIQKLSETPYKMKKITLKEGGNWSVELQGNLFIELGRGDEEFLWNKFNRFLLVKDELLFMINRDGLPLRRIDLRYENGFSVAQS